MLEEEGSLQDTPFKPNTTLKLNEDFGRSLAKVRSSSVVRFQDLRLVTRIVGDVPDQEERAVSLAHVFERRRAIIDSAIVRLLKKEKEMSVDNIAMQVCVCVCVCLCVCVCACVCVCVCVHACVCVCVHACVCACVCVCVCVCVC